jgi:hypothetical protein
VKPASVDLALVVPESPWIALVCQAPQLQDRARITAESVARPYISVNLVRRADHLKRYVVM